jgi:hypothetical protein
MSNLPRTVTRSRREPIDGHGDNQLGEKEENNE